MMKRFSLRTMCLSLCLAGVVTAHAATTSDSTLTTQSTTMDQTTQTMEPSKVTTKFASDFATFAGSQENAEALITGLRNGTPITLSGSGTTTTTTTGGITTQVTTNTTIVPPTKPMGYGNTYISLSLAKAQLAQYGITEPTPEQLQAALTGGTLTTTTIGPNGTTTTKTVTLDGILTQRADGMGWGEIAKANGFKLGQVISSMKSANKSLATSTSQTKAGRVAGKTTTESSTKIKTASEGSKSHANSHSSSSGRITTALGGNNVVYGNGHGKSSAHVSSLNNAGAGHGHGAGIVSASGGASVSSGPGKSGSAPGHAKNPK